MSAPIEVKVPDIGDFKNIPIIEIGVKVGDVVTAEQTLIVLESDKATLDVPAPVAGKIVEIKVAVGDKVSEGSLVAMLETADAAVPVSAPRETVHAAPVPAQVVPPPAPAAAAGGTADEHAALLVIGAGPGGYTAAFRAADLGAKVTIIDRRESLGGVCLNVGCIPSKALLHAAKVIKDAAELSAHGVGFGPPALDLDKLRGWKQSVVERLTGGLVDLARRRNVTVVRGEARFTGPNMVSVAGAAGTRTISFDQAIIAAGSEPVTLPFIPAGDPRVIDSTGALDLKSVPAKLLVIGGGIIGLEMATVYEALGSRVTVVELMDQLIPGADRDLVAPLAKRLTRQLDKILLKTSINKVEAREDGLLAHLSGPDGDSTALFDQVLVAVGRRANGRLLGAEAAGVTVQTNGFIQVDRQMRTNIAHIFAIGDVVGQPMLAHKATHEAKVAAEVACGHNAGFDARVIPSVAYTDPEVAWVGLTETEAKKTGVAFDKAVFPWAASGRSLALGRDEGFTKLLFEKDTRRLLGAGIVGPAAGDLIAEAALAIEMGADDADIGLTIHPHPTLSETVGLAAEVFAGTITDLPQARR